MATLKTITEDGKPTNSLSGSDNVGLWGQARIDIEPEFQLARALRGLTPGMRAMRQVFLPMTVREKQQLIEYESRLRRTFLHPGYDEGVTDIASKPFQRAVTLTSADKLDEGMQRIEADADRAGTPLTEFSAQAFEAAIDRGAVGILVDHPPALKGGTAKDDIERDARPFFRLVHADDLLRWGWERDASGREVLAFVAIYSEMERLDAKGKVINVQRVTYWTSTEWQVWERVNPNPVTNTATSAESLIDVALVESSKAAASQQASYEMVDEGTHPVGRVPYVPIVLKRQPRNRNKGRDPLQSRPCLYALAWKNVEHWQVSSDERNVLHYSGAPMILVTGVKQEDEDEAIAVGAGAQLVSSNHDTMASYVEPSGVSAKSLADRTKILEDQMTALAQAPLMRVANVTATGIQSDDKTTQAKSQTWAERLEWGIYNAFEMAQRWVDGGKGELPEDFDVAVFRDFTLGARSADEMRILGEARGRGDLSRETWLREAIERDQLVTVDDVDEELERIEAEGPEPSTFMPFGQQAPQFGQQPPAEDGEDEEVDDGGKPAEESKAQGLPLKAPPRQARTA